MELRVGRSCHFLREVRFLRYGDWIDWPIAKRIKIPFALLQAWWIARWLLWLILWEKEVLGGKCLLSMEIYQFFILRAYSPTLFNLLFILFFLFLFVVSCNLANRRIILQFIQIKLQKFQRNYITLVIYTENITGKLA